MKSPWLSMFGAYLTAGSRPVMLAVTKLPVLFRFEGVIAIVEVTVNEAPAITVPGAALESTEMPG